MSRTDNPRAVQGEDLVVKPLTKRRWRFLTICGEKLPSRSRGASIGTFPCSQINVFGVVPLRWLAAPPGGS